MCQNLTVQVEQQPHRILDKVLQLMITTQCELYNKDHVEQQTNRLVQSFLAVSQPAVLRVKSLTPIRQLLLILNPFQLAAVTL